jgi:hypothetical protein
LPREDRDRRAEGLPEPSLARAACGLAVHGWFIERAPGKV